MARMDYETVVHMVFFRQHIDCAYNYIIYYVKRIYEFVCICEVFDKKVLNPLLHQHTFSQ